MCCLSNRQEENIRALPASQDAKVDYMKQVFHMISQATDKDCAPSISKKLKKFYSNYWHIAEKDYTEIKKEYNQLMLDLLPDLRERMKGEADPLKRALILSRVGNYIDFNAIANVNKETALSLLEQGWEQDLNPDEYAHFLKELSTARSLAYLTDNCGEVALDRLVLEILHESYPDLDITVVVRGRDAANDATVEDAQMCGITDFVRVMGNGSDLPGNWLEDISQETKDLLHRSDLIISKGQGNFETLHESGLNIYYLFLCKCARFLTMFQAEFLQGMFVNENRI